VVSFPIRPNLRGLSPVPHGGAAQLRARGFDPETILDFSATTLPGGPPLAVQASLGEVGLERYPDPHCTELRQALAASHDLPAARVLPANGSVALIQAAAAAALSAGDVAVAVGPTFGEYAQAIQIAGGQTVLVETEDAAEVVAAARDYRARLVFVCNPNNPTGHLWSDAELQTIERAAFLVLDEAYAGFLRPPPAPRVGARRLVLRSLTKDRGLAGARLGYALGEPETLSALETVLTPWGVNALAQRVGVMALAQRGAYEARIDALWEARADLIAALRADGWAVAAGAAPYFLVEVGQAAAVTEALLQRGVMVRDATSFGLSSQVRISPRTPAENLRLVEALRATMAAM